MYKKWIIISKCISFCTQIHFEPLLHHQGPCQGWLRTLPLNFLNTCMQFRTYMHCIQWLKLYIPCPCSNFALFIACHAYCANHSPFLRDVICECTLFQCTVDLIKPVHQRPHYYVMLSSVIRDLHICIH